MHVSITCCMNLMFIFEGDRANRFTVLSYTVAKIGFHPPPSLFSDSILLSSRTCYVYAICTHSILHLGLKLQTHKKEKVMLIRRLHIVTFSSSGSTLTHLLCILSFIAQRHMTDCMYKSHYQIILEQQLQICACPPQISYLNHHATIRPVCTKIMSHNTRSLLWR